MKLLNNLSKVGWKLKKEKATSFVIWWRHEFIFKKEMSENSKNWGVNIERENLLIFLTTWGTSMKFLGKTWLNIKSHKKRRLHPLSRIYKFGTSYNYRKNLKWKKSFQNFRFFDFVYRASFCLSPFLSFLNINLPQLPKFEVQERFLRCLSFLFWV